MMYFVLLLLAVWAAVVYPSFRKALVITLGIVLGLVAIAMVSLSITGP